MKEQKQEIREYIIDRLNDGVGIEQHAGDLHHYLLNEDYFIIGTYKAEQFLSGVAFEAVECVKTYEQDNFGECSTDLSDPERVVNMLAYILGEEILSESQTLKAFWDYSLDEKDVKAIATELAQ
tara:strand:- start:477 stop:848 length:372 start_codon:yes stop_codon:yes gene_type:complete